MGAGLLVFDWRDRDKNLSQLLIHCGWKEVGVGWGRWRQD